MQPKRYPPEIHHCKICGKPFKYYASWAKRSGHPGYCCSRLCADRWHSMRMKGRPITEETKIKIGKANAGRKRPDLQAKWGKYLMTRNPVDAPVPFRKAILIDYRCEQCGKQWRVKQNGHKVTRQRHFCSKSCRSAWRTQRWAGENNPGYIHGQGERSYPLSYKKIRNAIKERDGYSCQRCGKEEGDVSHHIHHMDFDKRNTDIDNLITLCPSCHASVTAKGAIGLLAPMLFEEPINGYRNQNI